MLSQNLLAHFAIPLANKWERRGDLLPRHMSNCGSQTMAAAGCRMRAGPTEPSIFRLVSDRPFVPGFPLPVLVRFGLCRSSLFLASILVALSPHPKIPFLADKAQLADTRFCPTEAARRDFSAISRDLLQPPFGLCRQMKSRRSLSAPLSPEAKIPFLRRTWRPQDVVAGNRTERS
jgi:hypothetical protein